MSDVSQGPGWWQASDGRWYPPQPAAPVMAPPPPPGPPPRPQWGGPPVPQKSNRGCLIALAIVGALVVLGSIAAVVLLVVVGREVDDRIDDDGTSFSGNDENPPGDDVTIGECGTAEGTRFMRATVEVLNHSSKASNYIITVAFESEDGERQLATSTGLVNGLGEDQTTNTEINSFQESPGGEDLSCRVSHVERFVAGR